MSVILWFVLSAEAVPYQMLQPARTMSLGETEMGGGVGYLTTPTLGPLGEGAVLYTSGWGRYGATDRIELSGGAWMPLTPFDLGIHGNARLLLIGDANKDGLFVSVGAGLGTQISLFRAISATATVPMGLRVQEVDLWVAPQVSASSSLLGSATTFGAEVGVGVDTGGIPVYVAASYAQVLDVDLIGLDLGFGYNPGL